MNVLAVVIVTILSTSALTLAASMSIDTYLRRKREENPMIGDSYITTMTEQDGTQHQVLLIPVSALLDAIACHQPKCPECGVEAKLEVPIDNPNQWDANSHHNQDCSTVRGTPPLRV